MPRNRTIYNAASLYAGPSPATGFHFNSLSGASQTTVGNHASTGISLIQELFRVQSWSYNAETPRRDVFQFGELAAIDRLVVDSPNVTLNFSYYASSMSNEKRLGFTLSSGANITTCISGFLAKVSDEKNMFAKIVGEGQDAIDNSSTSYAVFGFGNMGVTSYQAQGAVGDFPTVSVTMEGLNMKLDTSNATNSVYTTGVSSIPAVDSLGNILSAQLYAIPTGTTSAGADPLDYSVLLPGDINFSIGTYQEGFIDFSDLKIQDYSIGVELARTALNKLGSKTAFSREINVPLTATLQFNAIIGDYATGSISENIKRNTPYNVAITINKPTFSYGNAVVGAGTPAMRYELKGAYLDSQDYSLDIGGNKTVALNFTCPISGPQDPTRGIFFSGIA